MIQFVYQGKPTSVWTDQEMRLMSMGGSFVAVQDGGVNMKDLCNAGLHKGGVGIVRCHGNPHEVIRVIQLDDGPIGCVAGWISEDEQ